MTAKPLKMAAFAIATLFLVCSAMAIEPIPLPENAKATGLHNGYNYKPFELDGARLIPRVEFLQPGRDWERLDVYVPKSAKPGDKLPCIINVYGGGYGQKGAGAVKTSGQALVDAGYVVVAPDYALGVSGPETIASWDVANAIRHVRANAEKYNVDPERIGICGWSAGGWLSQFVGYSGPADLRPFRMWKRKGKGNPSAHPTIQPRPIRPDHPMRVQAVVSDWGAGKLKSGNPHKGFKPDVMISADDPPLLTCYGGEPRELEQSSIQFLKAVGVPAEGAFLGKVKSTHVPKFDTPGKNAAGKEMTWMQSIVDFYDRYVKNPTRSSPPQIAWVPRTPASMSTTVKLLSVHAIYGDGSVHYTLDGSEPTTASAKYDQPIELKPGQTIKAIAVKPDLPASRIASYTAPTVPRPIITTKKMSYEAKVGEPFRVQFEADMPDAADAKLKPTWAITGRTGRKFRPYNPPRTVPWMQIDSKTGELTGVPRVAGVWPVVVGVTVTTSRGTLKRDETVADARVIVITVSE